MERSSPTRILLLEDDPAHAEAVVRSLEYTREPYEILVASSLREYRQMVSRCTPQLVLADLNLPDGLAFDILGAEPMSRAFPVLVMTSHGDEQLAVQAMKSGALDYVVKSAEVFADMPRIVGRALREWGLIQARKQAEEALKESEEQFRKLLNDTPNIAVQGYDPAGTITYWNKASELIYGYAANEAMGKSLLELIVPPSAHPVFGASLCRMAATGIAPPSEELSLLHKDGTRVVVLSSYAVLRVADRRTMLFRMDTDLTELKRAEQERLEMERRFLHTQKLESLGVLAGGIAHDFNNLLLAILGHADLALRDVAQASPANRSLMEIVRASRSAADLCRQMLAYSGKGRLLIEPMDLDEVVREMVGLLKTCISKKALLKLNLDDKLPRIYADSGQIRQVLMNLVINASEAIGEESGVITLSTGMQHCGAASFKETYLDDALPEGPYIRLEVSDTGCGMTCETRARLFEPFFTTKFAGRGLGMSAVLGIVRGHRGAIHVTSELGKGTTFKLLFPAIDDAGGKALPPAETTSAEWCGSGTVLLVDDEEIIREVARMMLEALGFSVLTAEEGEEALAVYREHRAKIVCILMDLTMPCMSGDEAFRELRRLNPEVRVIMSSGFSDQEIVSRFSGKGLAAFIQKPYQLEQLRAVMRAVLEHS